MTKRIAAACLMCALLSGCTSTQLYRWGNYENDLYRYYHHADQRPTVVADYLQFVAQLENGEQKPAPGLYAEAGTFLLLQGEREKAIAYYQMEHEVWPESRRLMSALIANLQEQQ